MSNIIFIEFYNKQNYPAGKWLSEPDLCSWENKLPCLTIRDMERGLWKGFVGISENHPCYGKNLHDLLKIPEIIEIFFSVYGGISFAGKLPLKYRDFTQNYWWIGIETSHGGDLMPLLKLDSSETDVVKMLSNQTYKDLHFIRKETNKLSHLLSKME